MQEASEQQEQHTDDNPNQEQREQLKANLDQGSAQPQRERGLDDFQNKIQKLRSSYLETDNPFEELNNHRIFKFKALESIIIKKQDRIVRVKERQTYRNHKGTFLPKDSKLIYNYRSPVQNGKELRTPETTYKRTFIESNGKNSSSQRLKKEMDNLMDHLFNDSSRNQPLVKFFSQSPKRYYAQKTGLNKFFDDYATYIQRNKKNIGNIFANIEIGNEKSLSIKRKLEQLKQRLNKIPNAIPHSINLASPPPFSQQKEQINQKAKKTLIKPELANFDFDVKKITISQEKSKTPQQGHSPINKTKSSQENVESGINEELLGDEAQAQPVYSEEIQEKANSMIQSITPTPGDQ